MDEIKRLAKQGKFFITRHALKRLKKRNFTQSDIAHALVNGLSFPDSQDESKFRTVCKLGRRHLTLSVLVKKVLVIKSCWESKRWEREAYEKEMV